MVDYSNIPANVIIDVLGFILFTLILAGITGKKKKEDIEIDLSKWKQKD